MIIQGDALERLRDLGDESVQCVVTSPPYWGLRDYGTKGQLGLEKTPHEYVDNLVQIFREVRRVLKDDGTLWLNLGDSYCGGGNNRGNKSPISDKQKSNQGAVGQVAQHGVHKFKSDTIKPKDLVGIPWRVAFALQSDGWYLRQDIIWHKPNPMPESVRDRCTKAHEYIFMLTKSRKYYFDIDAIREPYATTNKGKSRGRGITPLTAMKKDRSNSGGFEKKYDGRQKRSVWSVKPKPFKGAHFATFPPDLIEPCILAGSAPGDIVLDPFFGAGTVGVVSQKHKREFIGIELNENYIELATKRIKGEK